MAGERKAKRPTAGRGGLSGRALREALAVASRWLERNAAAIDAINVFPVPDGDTGTNLALTVRASLEALALEDGAPEAKADLGAVTAAIARGALLGARGNSGVILSQWWQGLATTFAGEEEAEGPLLRRALEAGAESAYGAIAEPREGTLITVARAAVPGRAPAAPGEAGGDADAIVVLARALALAEEAVERTPEQMPLLKAAGVVDAGGKGFAVLLQGLLHGLRGEALPGAAIEAGQIDPEWLARAAAAADRGRFGYCTEFIVRGRGLEAGGLRAALAAEGESLLVVGTQEMLHAHVHTQDPEGAFAIGARFGEVVNRKADNMQAEQRVLAAHSRVRALVAVVAVASGEGFQQLFREVGVAQVVDGGELFNPSAETLLTAARATHAASVILLPNDANVAPVAQQAARLAGEIAIHVLPTTSMPAGLTAALALEQGAPVEIALRQMAEAVEAVACGGVSLAAREVAAPVALRAGQPFALIDGRVIAAGESINEALLKLVAALRRARPEGTLLTLFVGAGASAEETEAAVAAITGQIESKLAIEVTAGGQPHYPYLVSLE